MAKVRLGFVSNSSSSSFIVASKNPEKLKVVIEIDLSEMIDETIIDKKELEEYFAIEYGNGFEEDEYVRPLFRKCKKALAEGKSVCIGTVSSDGDASEAFLYDNGLTFKQKDVEIIQGVQN